MEYCDGTIKIEEKKYKDGWPRRQQNNHINNLTLQNKSVKTPENDFEVVVIHFCVYFKCHLKCLFK